MGIFAIKSVKSKYKRTAKKAINRDGEGTINFIFVARRGLIAGQCCLWCDYLAFSLSLKIPAIDFVQSLHFMELGSIINN